MPELLLIVVLTLGAGICMALGGAVATIVRFRSHVLEQETRHFIIALGGGILLGAVALVLIPEGMAFLNHSSLAVVLCVAGGGVLFFLLEFWMGRRKHESPQLLGMLLDFIPETIALGGMLVGDAPGAILLAFLIGFQNLPEGFNSFFELQNAKVASKKKILLVMVALAFIGPVAGVSGYFVLSQYLSVLGALMLISSGGILYIIFQDIAPQARLEKHWLPSLGAVFGFCVALASQLMV